MTRKFPKLFERIKSRKHSIMHTQDLRQPSISTSSVAIISIPPGAHISMDSVDTGITSSAIIPNVDISTEHTFTLILDGYVDYIHIIPASTMEEGSIHTEIALLTPTSLSSQTGDLSITSSLTDVNFNAITMSTGTVESIGGLIPTAFGAITSGIYGYEAYKPTPPSSISMGSFEILPEQTTCLDVPLGPMDDPSMAFTVIESIPSGADIYIDGEPIGAKTSFMRNFTLGEHSYELRKPGYLVKQGLLTLMSDIPNIISENLQIDDSYIPTNSVAIISIPPGANVHIDGADIGVTSSAIIPDIDTSEQHTLELFLDGYENYIDNTFTVPSDHVGMEMVLLTPISHSSQTGNLNVTSNFIDTEFNAVTMSTGTEQSIGGTIPTTFNTISSGIYGYSAYKSTLPKSASMGSFEILPDKTTDLDVSLGPIDPGMALTVIESIPSGADIYIDGDLIGAKTSFMRNFTAEEHTYELRKPGYKTKKGSQILVACTPNIISEHLQPAEDAGSALMIAGTLTLGVMMMSSKPSTK